MKDRLQTLLKQLEELAKKYTKIIWSASLSILITLISHFAFYENYAFLYKWFGEAIIASATFLFIYFLGKPIIFFIGGWVETLIKNTVTNILYDFWINQSAKLYESFKKSSGSDSLIEGEIDPEINKYKTEISPLVLDTSAIIDGRILGVLKAGFLEGKIIVTQSAVDELKHMADKKNDNLKRDKGRRGLDILSQIKKASGRNNFEVVNIKAPKKVNGAVDKSILEFCVKINARIATLDFNLNKESRVYGVKVLNVNRLANEIKMNLAPGDVVLLKLLQEGKENGQSVGYLEDGTMIVVRESLTFLGEHREVVIEKVIQTDAGRMVFAHLLKEKAEPFLTWPVSKRPAVDKFYFSDRCEKQ